MRKPNTDAGNLPQLIAVPFYSPRQGLPIKGRTSMASPASLLAPGNHLFLPLETGITIKEPGNKEPSPQFLLFLPLLRLLMLLRLPSNLL